MGPLTVIKWANRALYLLLFISLIVVMGKWHLSITYTFLASVFCFILPILFLKDVDTAEFDTHTPLLPVEPMEDLFK
jgi:hypothetical protein